MSSGSLFFLLFAKFFGRPAAQFVFCSALSQGRLLWKIQGRPSVWGCHWKRENEDEDEDGLEEEKIRSRLDENRIWTGWNRRRENEKDGAIWRNYCQRLADRVFWYVFVKYLPLWGNGEDLPIKYQLLILVMSMPIGGIDDDNDGDDNDIVLLVMWKKKGKKWWSESLW